MRPLCWVRESLGSSIEKAVSKYLGARWPLLPRTEVRLLIHLWHWQEKRRNRTTNTEPIPSHLYHQKEHFSTYSLMRGKGKRVHAHTHIHRTYEASRQIANAHDRTVQRTTLDCEPGTEVDDGKRVNAACRRGEHQ